MMADRLPAACEGYLMSGFRCGAYEGRGFRKKDTDYEERLSLNERTIQNKVGRDERPTGLHK